MGDLVCMIELLQEWEVVSYSAIEDARQEKIKKQKFGLIYFWMSMKSIKSVNVNKHRTEEMAKNAIFQYMITSDVVDARGDILGWNRSQLYQTCASFSRIL